MDYNHFSVLKEETIDKLNINPDGVYVDATVGMGGHTKEIAERLSKGKIISFDQDSNAINYCKNKLSKYKNIIFVNSNFKNLKKELSKLGIEKIDGILYDLGASNYQFKDPSRGFTYRELSKLDMRMDVNSKLNAIDVINDYSESKLSKIFKEYGDEKNSSKLAKEIVLIRKNKKIKTNKELNEIITNVKGHSKKKNNLKNIYQSIRIEVNDEINSIKKSLEQAIDLLKINGRIIVITFHSLEDRVVKNIFWENKQKIIETPTENIHLFKTKKTIYPTKEEVELNKASRSSKLRVLIKNNEIK